MRAVIRSMTADDGMSTAEYAVGTCGAIGFAGILVKILTSPSVTEMISNVFTEFLGKFLG